MDCESDVDEKKFKRTGRDTTYVLQVANYLGVIRIKLSIKEAVLLSAESPYYLIREPVKIISGKPSSAEGRNDIKANS